MSFLISKNSSIVILGLAGLILLGGLFYNHRQKQSVQRAQQLYFQGKSFVAQKNYERAIELFRQALQLNPKHGMTYQMLGTMYDKKGEYPTAIEFYEHALPFALDSMEISRTHYNLGVIYRDQLKDYDKARKEFELSIKTHPPYIEKSFDPQSALSNLWIRN